MTGILEITPHGLYCRSGDFFIDPWRPVKNAVISHAHADHARNGSQSYLCVQDGKALLRTRLGDDATISSLKYGEILTVNSVKI